MFDQGDGGEEPPSDTSGPGSTGINDDPMVDDAGLVLVRSLLDGVISLDPVGLSDESIYSLVLGLEAVRRRVDVATAGLLTELGTRGSCDIDHGLSTEGWFAHNANLPLGATRSRVRTAKKLRKHFGAVLDAINNDRITWEHGRIIAKISNPRIIDQLVEMTEQLLVLADHMTFETWSREVHNIAETLDSEGGHKPGDDITDNHLNVSNFVDNTVMISGQLCGELGLIVRDSINDQADRIFHRMTRDTEVTNNETTIPNRATLRALALVELITQANSATSNGRGPRADLSLVVNASDPGTITSRDGIRIGDTDKYTSLCDPVFHPIITNTQGIVTNLGRTQRLASTAQRRAMAHRDGGCVFPGCDAPPEWTDAHHTHPWNKGGQTNLDDLASLCRHHHGITHRTGWTMTTTPDGWFTWTTPLGQVLHSQRHGRQHPNPNRQNHRRGDGGSAHDGNRSDPPGTPPSPPPEQPPD